MRVYWQRCAWVDRPVAAQMALDLVEDENNNMGLDDDWLLEVDRLDGQLQREYKQPIEDAGGLVVHPPGGMTHQLQAIDRGYGWTKLTSTVPMLGY